MDKNMKLADIINKLNALPDSVGKSMLLDRAHALKDGDERIYKLLAMVRELMA